MQYQTVSAAIPATRDKPSCIVTYLHLKTWGRKTLSEDKLTTSGLRNGALCNERLCFLQPDWWVDWFEGVLPNCAQQEYCFVLLVSLQVLKTLPAFVIVLIVKICRVTSPKLVFLSMYDKLKLKNDATYEGIKWDFLRNFCSSLNNKLFFPAQTPPT